jgi:hypothetical protein
MPLTKDDKDVFREGWAAAVEVVKAAAIEAGSLGDFKVA